MGSVVTGSLEFASLFSKCAASERRLLPCRVNGLLNAFLSNDCSALDSANVRLVWLGDGKDMRVIDAGIKRLHERCAVGKHSALVQRTLVGEFASFGGERL